MLLSPLLELWVVHVTPNLRAIMLDLVTVSELLLAPLLCPLSLCPGTTITVLILSICLFVTNVAKAASLFSHHVLSPISPISFDLLCFHVSIIVTVHLLRTPAGLGLRWRMLTSV